jgi:hypothetical protein
MGLMPWPSGYVFCTSHFSVFSTSRSSAAEHW